MIAKWLNELENKGEILNYDISLDDVTQEYVINYYIPTEPVPPIIMEFELDTTTNKVIFKE